MHTLRRTRVHLSHQILVDRLGQKRCKRRGELGDRDERRVQRRIGGGVYHAVLRPETPTVAAHVPIAQTFHELLERQPRASSIVNLERVVDGFLQPLEAAE